MQYITAVDIGGTGIKFGILTKDGEILKKHKLDSEADRGGARLMENVIRGIREINEGMNFDECIGIGIGTAGQVDHISGKIIFASDVIPGYTGTDVRGIMEKEFSKKVFVENDVNTAMIGEYWKGAGVGVNRLIGLTIGTGIGGCIIINGEVEHGVHGCAAEFGHIKIAINGRKCTCGSAGCYEQYASSTALIRDTKEVLLAQDKDKKSLIWNYIKDISEVNAMNIFLAAKDLDELCLKCVDEFCRNIAFGLSSLIHIFNPEKVIIGGGVSNEKEYITDKILYHLKDMIMPSFLKDFELSCALLGNDAGITGAAKLVLNGLSN